jgi:hypothetical protein
MSTKTMALPSISLASIVIGFISFSFTLAIVSPTQITFFRNPGSAERNSVQALGWKSLRKKFLLVNRFQGVILPVIADPVLLQWLHAFWDAFLTLGSAPNQIQDALSVLRQGLYEEREHLKRKRRRGEGDHPGSKLKNLYYEGGPTRVINDAVKDLIKEFKNYERPFLVTPHEGREKELEWSFDATQQHYRSDFWHRLLWLRARGHIYNIANRLEKAQIRRIAQETTETQFMLRDTMGMVREYENRLRAIEERLQMSRIGY